MSEKNISNESFSHVDSVIAASDKDTVHITFTTCINDTHHVGARISLSRKRAIDIFQSLILDFEKLNEEE